LEDERKVWEEKERKRKEMIELIKLEEKKLDELFKNVELWHKSEIIKNYIQEYKKKYLLNSLNEDKSKEIIEYFDWALKQADRIDPFKESPYSILDEKEKYQGYFHF
jgi:hypothetical protein